MLRELFRASLEPNIFDIWLANIVWLKLKCATVRDLGFTGLRALASIAFLFS